MLEGYKYKFGRIKIRCWKDENTMQEGYKYNVEWIQKQCWKDTNTSTTHKFLTSKENALYLYHVEPVLNALVATQVEFAILWHMG